MIVHWGFDAWDPGQRTVASLGNYDSVHVGHQAILKHLVNRASELSLPSIAVTFDPVPKKVLSPNTAPPLIQTVSQRLKRLESFGIDHAIVLNFNENLARKSPSDFIQQFLVDILRIRLFVVGENFSFGHQKSGNVALLQEMGKQNDFLVEGIPEIHKNGQRISSTLIRQKIQLGEMNDVTAYMGQPFSLVGAVVFGERVGSKMGIPTANLQVENEILPATGVYVTTAILASGCYPSVTNVGFRPTMGGRRLTVEVHLLDFSMDIYGQRMEVQFLKKLRDEKKFENFDHLKIQILTDIAEARNYHQTS